MRSFYCYVRTLDNQFLSCAVAAETIENLPAMAFERFAEQGIVLTAKTVKTMRFVSDPRNLEDAAGYPPDEAEPPTDGDGYCVYSEYSVGDPTH